MNKIKNDLKELLVEELKIKVDDLRREHFSLRLHAATNPIKDHTQLKKLKRNIARALTYLCQKLSKK